MSFLFKTPKAPTPVNPADAAKAQAEANRVWSFTPDQQTMFGSVDAEGGFVPNVGEEQSAVFVRESPFREEMRKQIEAGSIGTVNDVLFNNGLPARADPSQFSGDDMGRATFQSGMEYLAPEFEDRRRRNEQMLADRGLPIGGRAYSDSTRDMYRTEDDAMRRLAFESIGAGRAEQSRQYNLASSARSNAFNEIASVLGGNAVTPGMVNAPNAAHIDVMGPINQQFAAQNAKFNAKVGQQQAILGAISGIGSAAVLA